MKNAGAILSLSVLLDVFCVIIAVYLVVKYWKSDRTLVTFSSLLTRSEDGDKPSPSDKWMSTARIVAFILWVVFSGLFLSTLILASDSDPVIVTFSVVAILSLIPVLLMNGDYGVPRVFGPCSARCSNIVHAVAAAIFFCCFPIIFGCLADKLQEHVFYAFPVIMVLVLIGVGVAACVGVINLNDSKLSSLVAALEIAMMVLNAGAFIALGIQAYDNVELSPNSLARAPPKRLCDGVVGAEELEDPFKARDGAANYGGVLSG
jgi:hypothetical protein